jgi:hypothetical protein
MAKAIAEAMVEAEMTRQAAEAELAALASTSWNLHRAPSARCAPWGDQKCL